MKMNESSAQPLKVSLKHSGYGPGHPWYYKLGGIVLKPRRILATVRHRGYRGYNPAPFDQADNKSEPERSSTLRLLRKSVLQDFRRDLESYRQYACELREHRRKLCDGQEAQSACAEIHMSLKYNHLYNRFAHLIVIDDYLSRQLDLFDF